jgi:hypothetical protein
MSQEFLTNNKGNSNKNTDTHVRKSPSGGRYIDERAVGEYNSRQPETKAKKSPVPGKDKGGKLVMTGFR